MPPSQPDPRLPSTDGLPWWVVIGTIAVAVGFLSPVAAAVVALLDGRYIPAALALVLAAGAPGSRLGRRSEASRVYQGFLTALTIGLAAWGVASLQFLYATLAGVLPFTIWLWVKVRARERHGSQE